MSFEVLEEANARWDELVRPEAASADRLAALGGRLESLGIVAGERRLCTVLRPHLVTEPMLAEQSRVAALIVSALIKVRDAVLASDDLHRVHLSSFMEWVGELVELEPPGALDGAMTRLDAASAPDGLHFIELNADCPEGAGHHDSILDFFESLEAFDLFAAEYRTRPLRLVPRLVTTLLAAWERWGGVGSPSIAMLTRTEDPAIVSSLEVEVAEHRRRGVDAEICNYRDLTFADGRLRAGGRAVDLLYRALPTALCLELREDLEPLFAAVRAGAVCMVNPFHAELLGHKALFALMSDLSNNFGLSAAEQAAIRGHVPWARPLADGTATDEDGREVDLVEHVLAEREQLVLKPAHEFGGLGVQLGWHRDEGEWRRAVESCLEADYVVQRRVPLHRTAYPTIEAPGARGDYFEDTDPFAFDGQVAGMLTRLSPSEITNVHEGGSLAASFAIEGPGNSAAA